MSQATIGALRVNLGLDSAEFTNGLSAAQRQLRTAGQRMQAVGRQMATIGAGLSVAVTAPLVAMGRSAMQAATESREAMAQVESALASMGPVAGRTSEQLQAAARALQSMSTFDDDDILRKVTSNLLTFGQVTGDVFDRAQVAIVDLSTRLGQDLQTSTMMVGRALNDPIRGLTALRRTGIQFTQAQEDMIRSMVAAGDVAGAQAVMLAELERQFGGAAQAARDAAPGSDTVDAWREFQEIVGDIILNVLPPITNLLTRILNGFNSLSPGMQTFIVAAAGIAAAVGPMLVVLGGAVAAIGALLPVFGAIGTPLLAVAAAAAAVGVAFAVFGRDIMPVLQQFGQRAAEVLGPSLREAFEAVRAAVQAIGEAFSQFIDTEAGQALVRFAQAYQAVMGEQLINILNAALRAVTTVFRFIADAVNVVAALLRGDWQAAWNGAVQLVTNLLRGLWSVVEAIFPGISDYLRGVYEGAVRWFQEGLGRIFQWVTGKVREVGDAFRDLWDRVVGNSYIPDMVVAIAEWMGPRLQAAMVQPALEATKETADAFADLTNTIDGQMEGLFRSIASKDWRGVLGNLFEVLGQGEGRLGQFGRIGASVMRSLPGFATGASFRVGGSGGIDSQLVQFRATPGEMVDIRKPGQDAGGAVAVYVTASEYFDARVERVAGPMVVEGGLRAAQGGARMAAESANRTRYYLKGAN